MIEDDPRSTRRPYVQQLGSVIWPSFIAAALASAVMFAFIDPRPLAALISSAHTVTLGWAYTLGFVMVWLATLLSSALTCVLMGRVSDTDDGYPLE